MVTKKQRAKAQWVNLRWIQSNIKFIVPEPDFLHNLDVLDALHPDVISLNEVGGRVAALAGWAKKNGYLHVQPPRQHGMADDQAILLRASKWLLSQWGFDKMHEEPPGAPTARFLLWADAIYMPAHQPLLAEAYHSLAAVERGNKFNHIARLKYYLEGNANVLRTSKARRHAVAVGHGRSTVPVILAGDLNWSWTPGSWINKTLGLYFTCCHTALKRVKTLGKRSVDIVAKRGGLVRFVKQFTVKVKSDHLALVVDMQVRVH